MFTKFRSGGGGQYDLASFSGDASVRAIKSGDGGAAGHVEADEFHRRWRRSSSRLASTPRAASTTGCRSCGARTSSSTTRTRSSSARRRGTRSIGSPYAGKITVPDNPIQIADPALQFFKQSNPYAISQQTLNEVTSKLKKQRPIVRKYWVLASDFEQLFKSGDAMIGAAGR